MVIHSQSTPPIPHDTYLHVQSRNLAHELTTLQFVVALGLLLRFPVNKPDKKKLITASRRNKTNLLLKIPTIHSNLIQMCWN